MAVVALPITVLSRSYVRHHSMTKVSWASVLIDNEQTSADVFIGHPTENEAQAYLLVCLPKQGDYFLRFEYEDYRKADAGEFHRFSRHVWTRKPIGSGVFLKPLPFTHLNEYRLPLNGHLVTIQF